MTGFTLNVNTHHTVLPDRRPFEVQHALPKAVAGRRTPVVDGVRRQDRHHRCITPVAGTVIAAATMMAVVVPSAALWAAGGEALSRFLTTERSRRVLSAALAGLLVLTVALVWL